MPNQPKDTYLRAIRTKLGASLRDYDLAAPLPDRLASLLLELDEQEGGASGTQDGAAATKT